MMKICKLKYVWFDGEEDECYIITDSQEQLDKDLKEIKQKVNDKKDYDVRCLPSFYEETIKQLQELGYPVINYYDDDVVYYVDEELMGKNVIINKVTNKRVTEEL